MEPTEFSPITEDEIEDALKEADRWYRMNWGATMPPSQNRGMAKDVVRLVALVRQLQTQLELQTQLAKRTNDDEPAFFDNPCNRCGSPPGVRCPHDE